MSTGSPSEKPLGRRRRLIAVVALLLIGAAVGVGAYWTLGELRIKREVKKVPVWIHERQLERHRRQQAELPPPPHPPAAKPVVEVAGSDWPGFRGSNRDGIVTGAGFRIPWPSAGPKLLWKQPVGGGQSSFAIAGNRAWTLEQRGGEEAVVCYALADGRELWTFRYAGDFHPETIGIGGPRATPTLAGNRVYSIGASGALHALDAFTGKRVWSRNILEDAQAENLIWGMAGSPLIHAGRVFAAPGGKGASVIAYDAASGAPVWKSGRAKAGYSSPVLARLQGKQHLLVFDGEGLSAYAPEDGSMLWSFPWKTDFGMNAGQPIVVDDEHVLVSSGYGAGSALIRVVHEAGEWKAAAVWSNRNLKLKYPSAVLHQGHVYGSDESILVCVDVRTGERKWKGGRYGFAQVLLAGGHLVIQCGNGDLALVEASPEGLREVSRVPALERETLNHPAIGGGRLLIRNDRQMMCFDLR